MQRKVSHKLSISFYDVDASGWINGGKYFEYVFYLFDLLLRSVGYSIRDFLKNGFGFPPVHYEINFEKPCTYGDEILGTLQVTRAGNSSVELYFEFTAGNSEKLCWGKVVVVFTNIKERKPTPIPISLKESILSDD